MSHTYTATHTSTLVLIHKHTITQTNEKKISNNSLFLLFICVRQYNDTANVTVINPFLILFIEHVYILIWFYTDTHNNKKLHLFNFISLFLDKIEY